MAIQSTLRYLYPLTTTSVPRDDGFVEIHMSDVAKSYIRSIDLEECPFPQIAVTTAEAAWYFSHWNAATPAQVQAKEHGVCILVGPAEGEQQLHPCGPIAYMPVLMQLIAHKCQKEVRTRGTMNYAPSFVYEESKGRSIMPAAEHAKGSDCLICMEYTAAYRWTACFHTTDGPALVCLRCRNFILGKFIIGKKKKKHDLRAACIICRKASALVRHSKAPDYR